MTSMASPPTIFLPVQLFLVFVGTVIAGAAVSMRPDLWWVWGLGAVAAALASVGLPASWDSFPPLFRTLSAIGIVGVIIRLSPPGVRVAIASAAVIFHFTGIFSATTSPPPQPWIVEQAWVRVFHPYLNFIYLRNAYHFYSPDPGPASLLAYMLKTEVGTDPDTGKKQYETRWVLMPSRPADIKDPLGLAYYRRLSLTEHAARGSAGLLGGSDQFEKTEMSMRRYSKANIIPYHPVENINTSQYRLPNSEIIRYIMPSYASHVILENTPDKATAAKTTVKVYRLEHLTTTVERFRQGDDPFHPATYRPFFMGEFDARGNLIDPQEELLYWMVPIIPRYPAPGDENKKGYIDYMSVHALEMSRDEVIQADEKAGKVFNWSQMRIRP